MRNYNPEAEALLKKLLARQAAEDAAEEPPTPEALKKELDWLESYARGKPIRCYGGNFYGISRNRCSILRPAMIKAILTSGRATGNEREFRITPQRKAK